MNQTFTLNIKKLSTRHRRQIQYIGQFVLVHMALPSRQERGINPGKPLKREIRKATHLKLIVSPIPSHDLVPEAAIRENFIPSIINFRYERGDVKARLMPDTHSCSMLTISSLHEW